MDLSDCLIALCIFVLFPFTFSLRFTLGEIASTYLMFNKFKKYDNFNS